MEIRINGEARTVPDGLTVLALLQHLELDPSRLAIELDREIVKQPLWETTPLAPGAELEIVQFVGGG